MSDSASTSSFGTASSVAAAASRRSDKTWGKVNGQKRQRRWAEQPDDRDVASRIGGLSGRAGNYLPTLPFRAREGWRGPSTPPKAAMVPGEPREGEVIGLTGGSLEATPSSS